MTAFALVAVLVGILFGGPALAGPARSARNRREAARARRGDDAEQARQDAAARQCALAQLWTADPETAGVQEALSYQARVQGELARQSQEQHRKLELRDDQVQHRRRHVRDGNPLTPGYRLRVLAGLGLFLVVLVLGTWLDYLIFRGLHPAVTRLLPFALACLALIGITAGSVLFFDATRHHLVPAAAAPYARQVVALAGAMLAAGISVYVIVIAPYRSAVAGEAKIRLAQQQLASDQSQVLAGGGPSSQLITADRQALARARADLAQAQRVDRWSAAVLAVLDIPLSEAGFLGAELLLLDLAVFRCERARRRAQRADDALQQADSAFIDALHQILTQHGHTQADEVIPRIIARVSRLSVGTRSPLTGGQPASSGQTASAPRQTGNAAAQASGPGSQGPPGPAAPGAAPPTHPSAGAAGSTWQAFTPPRMPQPPGGGNGQDAWPVSGVTILHPNGDRARNGGMSVGGSPGWLGPGGAMTPPAGLPAEEFDMTACRRPGGEDHE